MSVVNDLHCWKTNFPWHRTFGNNKLRLYIMVLSSMSRKLRKRHKYTEWIHFLMILYTPQKELKADSSETLEIFGCK